MNYDELFITDRDKIKSIIEQSCYRNQIHYILIIVVNKKIGYEKHKFINYITYQNPRIQTETYKRRWSMDFNNNSPTNSPNKLSTITENNSVNIKIYPEDINGKGLKASSLLTHKVAKPPEEFATLQRTSALEYSSTFLQLPLTSPSPRLSSKFLQSPSPSPRLSPMSSPKSSSKLSSLTRTSSKKISFVSSDEEYEYMEEYLNGLSDEHIIMIAKYYNIYFKNPTITHLLNNKCYTIYQITLIIKWIYGYIDTYIYDELFTHNVKNNTKQQKLEKYMNIQLTPDSFIFTKKRSSLSDPLPILQSTSYYMGENRSLWSRDMFLNDIQSEENNSGQRAECLQTTNSEGDRRSPEEFGHSIDDNIHEENTHPKLPLTIKPSNISQKNDTVSTSKTISQRIYNLLTNICRCFYIFMLHFG
jgi:hypothetical protein